MDENKPKLFPKGQQPPAPKVKSQTSQSPPTTTPEGTRSKPKSKHTGTIFGANQLDVHQDYLNEAAAMDCECRWVSAKTLKENFGEHQRGWAAYKFKSRPAYGTMKSEDFAFGHEAEKGVVRRGDMVLAIRPIEMGDQHRQMLSDRRNRYKGYRKAKVDELKAIAQESGGRMSVDDREDE